MPTFRFYPRLAGQTGFTLVELITVILILGVLAAVAIPRYADLQGKARESKVRAIAGSMKAAAGIAKAQAVATGVSCASATAGTVTLEGRSIALNHCYPQALTGLTAGILGAANVESDGGWTAAISTGTAGAGTSEAGAAAGGARSITLAGSRDSGRVFAKNASASVTEIRFSQTTKRLGSLGKRRTGRCTGPHARLEGGYASTRRAPRYVRFIVGWSSSA